MESQNELPFEGDMSAEQIDGILHRKHGSDPWTYFSELREKTGTAPARTIDAYALHVWPSSFRAIAYEIKTDRSDFMNEIDDPSKRKPFVENSTEFYFVVPHGLISPSEVPAECGLMYAQAGDNEARVIRKKAAPQRDIDAFDPLFVASLLREESCAYQGADLFHLAGERLTHEDLQEYIDREAKKRHVDYEFRRELKEEVREELEEEYETSQEVYRWLKQHAREFGLPVLGLDAESLQEWWDELNEVNGNVKKNITDHVKRAERELDKIRSEITDDTE